MKQLMKLSTLVDDLRSDEGAAAVEFAVVIPLFLMFAFAIIVYGIYFASLIAVTNAASEGARASVAGMSDAERQTLASNAAISVFSAYAPFLNSSNMAISTQVTGSTTKIFQVSVSYDFTQYGLAGFGTIIPVPSTKPSITVSVAEAGTF